MSSVLIQPVVSVICKEPIVGRTEIRDVTRRVYPLILTEENLTLFWNKAKTFRVLFSDEIHGDFKKFLETFLTMDEHGNLQARGVIWVVDDFLGVFYMTSIRLELECVVHFSFFDGRLHGRAPLVREMIKYVFERYNFRRMNVELPLYANDKIQSFIEMIGFVEEGRKRKAVMFDGELFDVRLYGLLREEASSWI